MTQPSNDVYAAIALSRFGLGADGNGIAPIVSDPRGVLREEITERFVPVPVGPELQPSADLLVALYDFQEERKQMRAQVQSVSAPAQSSGVHPDAVMSGAPTEGQKGEPPAMAKPAPAAPPPYLPQQVFLAELDARFNGTIRQPLIGFGERLAMFWANHFAVSIASGEEVHILAGAFEREAIRPHVFGRFSDMLLAVETHPAMLSFLDNRQSIGPNSKANANGKRGLNENLARETLELHTLGVDGGYTQADVTALARVITGWTVVRGQSPLGASGSFAFNGAAHEPGDQTLLGLTYANDGFAQGRDVLHDLSRHPATARHIATKLARHFVADAPPPALVQKLSATFTKTEGDLSAVYLALLDAEEAWDPKLAKVRSPHEFMIALLRASGERLKPNVIVNALAAMGQRPWAPAGPNGFADTVDAWASSEGLSSRMDVANTIANAMPPQTDPRRLVSAALGPLLSDETLQAVSRAETRGQGLSIAYLSPEFQRR